MKKSSSFSSIDLDDIVGIALEAGRAVMDIYEKDFEVEYKEDSSPLTEADLRANEIICSGLEKLWPEIPMLSEENSEVSYDERREWEFFWCIDPIDGTKEFIKKSGEFTINIALVHKDTPVVGVVFAPALKEIYFSKKGSGAWKSSVNGDWSLNEDSRVRLSGDSKEGSFAEKKELVVVASKSHLNEETKNFINSLEQDGSQISRISKGSSLKLLMVAEGTADIYPRLGPTMEWDTAAADAIVRESGKMTYVADGVSILDDIERLSPLVYNKKNLLNPWFIVC
ncbi:3'(2'),5'-bisphosphate nucleotidase [Hydrogenimonas sp.]|nr:3'(2'),5'-bisphosphate nucleotidase [Hydrogenimonas sp.]